MCLWTLRSYTGARRSVLVDTLRSHCHCPARACVTVGFAHTACSHPLGHGSRSTLQHINESGSLDEFDGYVGKKAYLEMDAVYVRGDGCLAAMHVSSVMVNGKVLCLRKVPMSPHAQLEIQPLRSTASSQSAHPTSARTDLTQSMSVTHLRLVPFVRAELPARDSVALFERAPR